MVQLNRRFSTKIDDFTNSVLFRLDATVQESAYQAAVLAQKLSPVFTGAFRDSWRIAQGTADTSTSPGTIDVKAARSALAGGRAKSFGESVAGVSSPSTGTLGRLRQQSQNVRVGGVAVISNSVKYADVVELGDPETSRAPRFITKQVLSALPDIIGQAAAIAARRIS